MGGYEAIGESVFDHAESEQRSSGGILRPLYGALSWVNQIINGPGTSHPQGPKDTDSLDAHMMNAFFLGLNGPFVPGSLPFIFPIESPGEPREKTPQK